MLFFCEGKLFYFILKTMGLVLGDRSPQSVPNMHPSQKKRKIDLNLDKADIVRKKEKNTPSPFVLDFRFIHYFETFR